MSNIVCSPKKQLLTLQERRRILRRIANRESARRVRARRLDLLDDMAQKVGLCIIPLTLALLGKSSNQSTSTIRLGTASMRIVVAQTALFNVSGQSQECITCPVKVPVKMAESSGRTRNPSQNPEALA